MNLTVIIPLYNGRDSITGCLDSLVAQTYRDFHVLVINDGSSDDSADVVGAYIEAHPSVEITLISQTNCGAALTRNHGIETTETPYIAFIDQDDFVAPEYLQTYVTAIQDANADIVCGGYQRYDAKRRKAIRIVSLNQKPWSKFVVLSPWAHIYRTEFLKENNIRFLKTPIGEDVYFSIMAYAHTDRIVTMPDVGYYWVNNPVSVSNSRQRHVSKQVDPFTLLDALASDLPENNRIEKAYIEYFFYRYIVWYLLFTVRQSSPEQVESQYHRLIRWLGERYPSFEKNPLISLFGPKGELFSIRLSVFGFNLLYRMHIALPCLKLFSNRNGC